jgi:peptidoglycan hydrolase-like protein with peptidoglycan-binding domain
VIKFQQANKLVADGIVGAKTMEVLKGTKPSTPPIKLTDVCEYYDAAKNPHQKAAIEWLQTQIPVAVLEDFGKRWRKQ